MSARTVALDEEAYAMLKSKRRSGETFSDAVKRLARPKRPLTDFAGVWGDMTTKERARLTEIYSQLREAELNRAIRVQKRWDER